MCFSISFSICSTESILPDETILPSIIIAGVDITPSFTIMVFSYPPPHNKTVYLIIIKQLRKINIALFNRIKDNYSARLKIAYLTLLVNLFKHNQRLNVICLRKHIVRRTML